MKPTYEYTSWYLREVLAVENRKDLVHVARASLKGLDFDAVAVSGVSGIVSGVLIAAALKKPLVIVRKPSDGTHSVQRAVEGPDAIRKFIVVDDFVETGATFHRIIRTVAVRYPNATCEGVYCYAGYAPDKAIHPYRVIPSVSV